MKALDFAPHFEECTTPEPSLRKLIRLYYSTRIDDDALASTYMERYVDALSQLSQAEPAAEPALSGYQPTEGQPERFERLDGCRRALEVIALGDSKNPVVDAGDELVALGFWDKDAVAEMRRSAPASLHQPQSGEAIANLYEALEPALEALVNRCNQGGESVVWEEVISAEAALERLYRARVSPAALTPPPPAAEPAIRDGQDEGPIELQGIAETLAQGGGFWRSCSGCHESNEGWPTGAYSQVMKCHLGNGCDECGGIGAIWDTTDYDAMAAALAAAPQEGAGDNGV